MQNPIILLHGAIGTKFHLQPLETALTAHFKVYNHSFAGHGGSLKKLDSFSMKNFADDVIAFMDEQGIKKANIVGYSMGGYVALTLAKHYPDRIGKAFIFSTKWDWNPTMAAKEAKRLGASGIKELKPSFAAQLMLLHAPQKWEDVLKKTSDMMIEMGNQPPLSLDDLADIKPHFRVAVGDKDPMVSIDETLAIYRALPHAQLTVLPHTVHAIEKMPIDRLVFEIRDFM